MDESIIKNIQQDLEAFVFDDMEPFWLIKMAKTLDEATWKYLCMIWNLLKVD